MKVITFEPKKFCIESYRDRAARLYFSVHNVQLLRYVVESNNAWTGFNFQITADVDATWKGAEGYIS
jgi:hypothetical protein